MLKVSGGFRWRGLLRPAQGIVACSGLARQLGGGKRHWRVVSEKWKGALQETDRSSPAPHLCSIVPWPWGLWGSRHDGRLLRNRLPHPRRLSSVLGLVPRARQPASACSSGAPDTAAHSSTSPSKSQASLRGPVPVAAFSPGAERVASSANLVTVRRCCLLRHVLRGFLLVA